MATIGTARTATERTEPGKVELEDMVEVKSPKKVDQGFKIELHNLSIDDKFTPIHLGDKLAA